MNKIYDGDIPFSVQKDEQMHYPYTWMGEILWKKNKEFTARLVFSEYVRGSSAAYFYAMLFDVTSDDVDWEIFLEDKQVVLFMKEVTEILSKVNIKGGVSDPVPMCFQKYGKNYGLRLLL